MLGIVIEKHLVNLAMDAMTSHRNVAMDAMSCALRKAAQSLFSNEIDHAQMPRRFSRPLFISYDRKADPIEHVSHYIQMMSLYS